MRTLLPARKTSPALAGTGDRSGAERAPGDSAVLRGRGRGGCAGLLQRPQRHPNLLRNSTYPSPHRYNSRLPLQPRRDPRRPAPGTPSSPPLRRGTPSHGRGATARAGLAGCQPRVAAASGQPGAAYPQEGGEALPVVAHGEVVRAGPQHLQDLLVEPGFPLLQGERGQRGGHGATCGAGAPQPPAPPAARSRALTRMSLSIS